MLSQKNKVMQSEISDCPVQRTVTTEKCAPCELAGRRTKLDNSVDNNMVISQTATDDDSEPIINSNLDDSFERVINSDLFQNKEGRNS